MRPSLLIFLILTLSAVPLSPSSAPKAIFWNVGQGQWITIQLLNYCFHLDMGGESAPWMEIHRLCSKMNNQVVFTHFDRDHINFAGEFELQLPHLSLCHLTLRKPPTPLPLPTCRDDLVFKKLFRWTAPPTVSAKENQNSVWIMALGFLLIPGDTPSWQEKQMMETWQQSVRVLTLAHHGSRYSNSPELLDFLVQLKMGVSSSRKNRYGHPHPDTIERFSQKKIPVLTTEEQGHIFMKIDINYWGW